jgi:hypothetical protein
LCATAQTIRLVGADAQGTLKFTVTTRNASFRIPIELQAEAAKPAGGNEPGAAAGKQEEKKPIDDFRIVVDDFVAPDGRHIPASVTIDGHPVPDRMTIKEVDRPILSVNADFPIVGDYKSNIVMFYRGNRAPSLPLIVTRQLVTLTLRIDTADTRAATVLQDGSASMHVVVQETSGQPVSIDPPALVGLVLKRGGKIQQEAPYRLLDLRLAGRGRATPDNPCAEDEKAKAVGSAAPAEYIIEPLGQVEFLLTICGLSESGEYSGILRVSNRETNPVDKAVTIFVKKSGWIAFLFIFFGVGASWLMRRWTKEEKPKLEAERRIGDLEQDLKRIATSVGTPQNETETKVFAAMLNSLDKARTEVERSHVTTATAVLDVSQKKMQNLLNWLNAGRRLNAAEAAGNVATIRRDWEAMGDTYFIADAPKDDFATAIAAILKAIDDAVKDQIVRDVADFRKRMEAVKTANPEVAADLDNAVKPLLDEASDDVGKVRIEEANDALTKSKAMFASVLAKALKVALTKPAPIGFTPEAWTKAGAELGPVAAEVQNKAASAKTRAEANEAIRSYEKLNKDYLGCVFAAADNRIAALRVDVDHSTTIPPDKKPETLKPLEQAAQGLKIGRAQLDNADYNGAIAQYQAASKLIQAVIKAVQSGGAPLLTGAKPPDLAMLPATPPSTSAPAYEGDVEVPARERKKRYEQITDWIARYDLLLNLGVLLIATFLGMKLLWADDPVWGGWTAYTVAFLWGIGLQQIGGAGFEGLPAITKKLTE